MRDQWYSDKRDLVRWSVLFHIAKNYKIQRIIQLAYYRGNPWEKILIGSEKFNLPREIIKHFRDIRNVEKMNDNVKIQVFYEKWGKERDQLYQPEKKESNILTYLLSQTLFQFFRREK